MAESGGADRVELNCALMLGGLTPSLGALREARAAIRIPLIAMIRPRAGGFCYSASEFKVMQRDVEAALAENADGIAFGILTAQGTIDLERCRQVVKQHLALYIGGMGPRGRNFYNDYARRMGYEAAAVRVQDLYLAGDTAMAAAAVPDSLVDEVALAGPAERIRARLEAWREAGRRGHVNSLLAGGASIEALRLLAEELL